MTLAKGHSTFSKDFSSETTRPISLKFHMQPSDYMFGSSHMAIKAAMPIYDKKS